MRSKCLVLAVLPLFAATPVGAQDLPGVANEETTIRALPIQQIERGNADVVFMRDQTQRWYRVELTEGRLDNVRDVRRANVDPGGIGSRVDRLSTLIIDNLGIPRNCGIDSIRAAQAPPMVDSKSIVTLD